MLFTLTALGYYNSPDIDLSTCVVQTGEKLKQHYYKTCTCRLLNKNDKNVSFRKCLICYNKLSMSSLYCQQNIIIIKYIYTHLCHL